MILQSLLGDIEKLVNSSVVKYGHKATLYETPASLLLSDLYTMIINGTDTFESYGRFEVEAIQRAHVPYFDPSALTPAINIDSSSPGGVITIGYGLADYAQKPSLIPPAYRAAVLREERFVIKRDYENNGDLNNYYRELSGFPNGGVADLYLTDEEYTELGITEDVNKLPIHKLSDANINRITSNGTLNKYINMYPKYKYLKHMGSNKINPYKARSAKNFALLKTTSDVPSSTYDLFNTIYDQNREYVTNVIYNPDIYSEYEMYDNFIALSIMVMTIQRVLSSSFKKAIQRDLYDWTFIKNLYKAYNIPFLEDLTMDNHVTLTKNFNKLLQYKGTDKVLFDICSLLGHNEISIYKYFLVKDQKYNTNGAPVTTGDNDDKYDLYFQAVDLDEENIALSLQNKTNTLSYEEVTEDDPYWWDSGDLKNTILEKEFNYIETKYISLNIMHNMTDILFDVAYAFRLIFDKKDDIVNSGLVISLPRLTSEKDFSIFDVMVFLIAATCKNNGFAGNIPGVGEISHIYGFNFNINTVQAIKTLVNNNRKYLNQDIIDYFDAIDISGSVSESLSVSTFTDIDTLYTNIKELRVALVNGMFNTKKTEDYFVYRQIYDTLLTEDNVTTMFTRNGTVFTTYTRYIEAVEPLLYTYLDPASEYTTADRNTFIDHVLSQIEDAIPSFRNLSTIISDITPIYNAILALIRFFKSYTVDVHSFNIWYLMNDKYLNNIKVISKIALLDSSLWMKSHVNGLYSDQGYTTSSFGLKDRMPQTETYELIYED